MDMIENSEQEQQTERISFIGDKIEKGIIVGDEIFLDEPDRIWLKKIAEKAGEKLSGIRGAANLSEQGEDLINFFLVNSRRNQGCDRVGALVSNVVVSLLENNSGNVFEKGKIISDDDQMRVSALIHEHFEQFYEKEYKTVPEKYEKGSWERKTMYRKEAIMAVTSKLLWILASEDETEAIERQKTSGVMKHLRERILRGLEKEGVEISKEVKRFEGKAESDKDPIIRHLPAGAIAFILDTIGRM